MTITSDRFIEGLKRRITMPASQVLMKDSDILAMADYVMKSRVVPLIKSVRQDFFVLPTLTQLVSGQKDYAIPYRAIGRGLRDLKLLDTSNGKRDLVLIALEDEHLFRSGTLPLGFFFNGDKISLVPAPSDSTYSLQIWWEMPPSQLVKVSDAARVVSVTATDVTVSSVPATMVAGIPVDFIKGVSGNSTIGTDAVITGVVGNTISFDPDVIPLNGPLPLSAGDYISLAQTTPVLQIPDDSSMYLETCTAIQVLKAIGDYEGAERLSADETEEAKNLKLVLEPRIEGEQTKIINRRGLVRGWRGRFLTSTYYY